MNTTLWKGRDMGNVAQGKEREAVRVEHAALIPMIGVPALEALPSREASYELVDPFILVHEAQFPLSQMVDNILEVLSVAVTVKVGSALIYSIRALDAVKAKKAMVYYGE